jgi:hypothetical protein
MNVDATPVSLVNMVVLDWIVMGHTVSYISLMNQICSNVHISIMPLVIASMIWPMLVVEYFVLTMSWSMELTVRFRDVLKSRLLDLRHAPITRTAGTIILFAIDTKAYWGLEDYSEELMKNTYPGYRLESATSTPMKSQPQKDKLGLCTSLQIDSIVWRQSALLVV